MNVVSLIGLVFCLTLALVNAVLAAKERSGIALVAVLVCLACAAINIPFLLRR